MARAIAFLILFVILNGLFFFFLNQGPISRALAGPPKWEYRIESPTDTSFTTQMNAWGKEGWELISARRASSSDAESSKYSYEVILKRKL